MNRFDPGDDPALTVTSEEEAVAEWLADNLCQVDIGDDRDPDTIRELMTDHLLQVIAKYPQLREAVDALAGVGYVLEESLPSIGRLPGVSDRAPDWGPEAAEEIAALHQAREVVSGENYRLRAAITDAAAALESVARVLRQAAER